MTFTREALENGIRVWRSSGKPADLHNILYLNLGASDPNGDFSEAWWKRFSQRIQEAGGTSLGDERPIIDNLSELTRVWNSVISPNSTRTIADLDWEMVSELPILIDSLPTGSEWNFTAWFCHLIAPPIFPAIDNHLIATSSTNYELFYREVQQTWKSTDMWLQQELLGVISEAMEATEILNYPYYTKIAELCFLGTASKQPEH